MNSAMPIVGRRMRRAIGRASGRCSWLVSSLSPATAAADDIVLRWNEIAAQTATATSPFNQARIGAIVQLAVFEAVNAITGEYEPYLDPATVAPPGTSVEAAVVTAAHKALTTYFPAAVVALDAARDTDLGAIPDGPAKTDGIAVGMAAANAMIALRAADGSSPLTTIIPTSTVPGDYQLTTGCAAGHVLQLAECHAVRHRERRRTFSWIRRPIWRATDTRRTTSR